MVRAGRTDDAVPPDRGRADTAAAATAAQCLATGGRVGIFPEGTVPADAACVHAAGSGAWPWPRRRRASSAPRSPEPWTSPASRDAHGCGWPCSNPHTRQRQSPRGSCPPA
jgi:hypothetical protein